MLEGMIQGLVGGAIAFLVLFFVRGVIQHFVNSHNLALIHDLVVSSHEVVVRQGGVYAMEQIAGAASHYRGHIAVLLASFVRRQTPGTLDPGWR